MSVTATTRLLSRARSLLPGRADYAQVGRTWRGDLLAGLTVGIVALPLALGFGVSSGLSAEAGLITAIVAGLVAAVFGGSHVQVSGPTGAMVVVLVPIVAAHGAGAVVTVTLMAGVIIVVAGALRIGRAVSFIPWPVIEGFTLGIAVIIFAQQIPALVSPHVAAASEHSSNAIVAAIQSFARLDAGYAFWALGAVAVVAASMLGAPLLHRAIPGSLVGIVVVTILGLVVGAPLARIGALPSTLPAPLLPDLDPALVGALVAPAATVAALAAIESLLSARVASTLADTGDVDPDRELVGQGLASIASSLFGGMPATGAIARTAVNVRSGGRSRLAAIVHAVVLLLVVLVIAAPIGQIPLAALSGVLMVTAVRMVHPGTVRAVMRSTRADALAFVVTAVVTVSFDLIVAVIIGVVLAGVVALRSMSRASTVRRDEILGTPQPGDERIAILRLGGPLFFAAADRVAAEIDGVRDVSVVILRMSRLELVDATGARALGDIVQTLERRGVTVLIKGVQPRHEGLFRTVGVLGSLRHHNHLFIDLPSAIAHARRHVRRESASA
ncbi:SulP family inorganic anion transporter [Microbacterium dextranolyticum]|uniref:MFS transporter n=1 Tax=Microbacterium dextranolyticum TaxID=36806 RepID=A0A9W6HP64_9MICO|nr:SulP family inorganic anion transporter [Microbacterium dextranolyticum]MBM7462841.1 SulP family sulfate permease [Microbacterium dextranolyticum]GLJ96054.1 MFS transporter [Microbacterium dextranolyticum]